MNVDLSYQRLKSKFLKKFLHSGLSSLSFGDPLLKKFQKTLILAFEGNSAFKKNPSFFRLFLKMIEDCVQQNCLCQLSQQRFKLNIEILMELQLILEYTILISIRVCTLNILFSSNHNIHKSLHGLCFWASDPLIDKF